MINITDIDREKVIIILGSPGAGKGTQAELLSEKFNLYFWDTSRVIGKIIESAPKGAYIEADEKKYYFKKQKELRRSGKLWQPEFLVYFAKEKIKELSGDGEGIALVGSPRTLYEAKQVIPLLKALYEIENIKVVLIEITEKEAIWRNTHRRECKLALHPVLYSEETAKLTRCMLDGSKLFKRADDTPKIIRVRLKEYKKRTLPLIDYFKKEGLIIVKVDGSPTPDNVFKNILKGLEKEWLE